MSKNDAMKALGATDGQNGATWDPEVLQAAAESCLRGEAAVDFPGRPTDNSSEAEMFAAEWNAIQRERDTLPACQD